MNSSEVEFRQVSTLQFDRQNPRLVEFGLNDKSTETEVIRILWDAMDVAELVSTSRPTASFATSR